jgi:pimeloyl-ACP methyl ester carboxylesterase
MNSKDMDSSGEDVFVSNVDHSTASRHAVVALLAAGTAFVALPHRANASDEAIIPKGLLMSNVRYRTQRVGDVDVFYREAGPVDAPVILLLHGFPTSSHMFRDLIPALAGRCRVIAPDLPGFGQTKAPPRGEFEYSFDSLAAVLGDFVDAIGLTQYALYIFDYGAPTGLRLAMRHPERVTAIITQNGNAYVEGFSQEWGPWETYWREPTFAHREATRASLTDEAIRFQHEHGAPAGSVSPDGYLLDTFHMRRPGAQEIQMDLILSYRTNLALYPAFQAYFREHLPPLLAVWGKNDAFFIPPGAEAYRRDNPGAGIHLLDAGHFALETHHKEIADLTRDFLSRRLSAG